MKLFGHTSVNTLLRPLIIAATVIHLGCQPRVTSAPIALENLATLKSFWHEERIDYFETATEMGQNAALNVFGYSLVRPVAQVFKTQLPETIPLDLYWSEALQDNATVASPDSVEILLANGYEKKATEGFIYASKHQGTVPLKLYYSPKLQDYLTTTSASGESSALAAGYQFIRLEGFALPLAEN